MNTNMKKYFISKNMLQSCGDTNHGFFDIFQRDPLLVGNNPNVVRRNGACSMGANYKGEDHAVTYMYIPLGVLSINLGAKDAISEIEKSIREWVKFGRQCGFAAEFVGIERPDVYATEKFKPGSRVHSLCGHNDDDDDSEYDGDPRAIIIRWKHSDLLNGKHGLATFSFFRYFYSDLSQEVYRSSIYLYNNISEWNELKCLMFAHYLCKQKYTGYYGLIDKVNLFVPQNKLSTILKNIGNRSEGVNRQWAYPSPLSRLSAEAGLIKVREIFDFIPGMSKLRSGRHVSQILSQAYEIIRVHLNSFTVGSEAYIAAILLVENALHKHSA